MKTAIIQGSPRHRLLIGEHPDCAYIASTVDGAGIGGFYTADELLEIEAVCRGIRRRIRERAG